MADAGGGPRGRREPAIWWPTCGVNVLPSFRRRNSPKPMRDDGRQALFRVPWFHRLKHSMNAYCARSCAPSQSCTIKKIVRTERGNCSRKNAENSSSAVVVVSVDPTARSDRGLLSRRRSAGSSAPTPWMRLSSCQQPSWELRLAVAVLQVERARIYAVPVAGWLGAVVEDVPQVRAARRARHLDPVHEEAGVVAELHGVG